MKINLPALTKKRIRWLLDHVYETETLTLPTEGSVSVADTRLFLVVKSVQLTNLQYRGHECEELYRLFSEPYFLDPNSEGTTRWLAMALAIKELCALSDDELKALLTSVC